ncbi:C1-like protein [Artemisia annua]|uniref:C1-like protein n=1 Tax=Artemisia annua TaxID=35608 RepID=A0A2U1L6Q0_ARTAN|nr:C1-like protein [Artemisia annua]
MANEKSGKEKMEEIIHFGHEENPLKLIENSEMLKAHSEYPLMLIVWETIIGIIGVDFGNNEEKPKGVVVECDLCEEPLSIGDSAYFAHIKCAMNALQQPSTPRDNPSTSASNDNEISLLHFPMSESSTDPLKLLHSKIIAQDDKETIEINHWSHPAHPLVLNVEDPQGNNMTPGINSVDPIEACDKWYKSISYSCKACDFQLCMFCALKVPISLAHRYCKGHEIPLTYPPVEDHPEDFYCDICEEEMDPKFPLYHCHNQNPEVLFTLTALIDLIIMQIIWHAGTITRAYHKHPLTYVRRK